MKNNKRQIFIGIFIGVLISFLTLILLTTPLPQIKAQQPRQPRQPRQTQPKYTVFKTQNEGFKFFKIIGNTNQLAPLFAQTPGENSPAEQVATKWYVDQKSGANYTVTKVLNRAIFNVNGPICAEEFGLYIYKKVGNRGQIRFTNLNGRVSGFHVDLDNSDGGYWNINFRCDGDWSCEGHYLDDTKSFLIIEWDWNKVAQGETVVITGATGGRGYGSESRLGLPWAISSNTPDSVRLTGRKFLGNNYGCGRNWWMQVDVSLADLNTKPEEVFYIPALPSNLKTEMKKIEGAEDIYKYVNNKLVSYIRRHKLLTKTTIPLDMSAFYELCADEDGCTVSFYQIGEGSVLKNAVGDYIIKYDLSTNQWVMGGQGGTLGMGKDNDTNRQSLLWAYNCYYITDAVHIDGKQYNDNEPGIYSLNWCPDARENKILEFVFKD